MALRIGILLKQVPLQLKAGADGLMDRSGASQINPYCKHALEEAIKLKEQHPGSTITIFTMGPPNFEQSLRKAIAMGADEGVLLSDRKLAGSDTMATAKALAGVIQAYLRDTGTQLDLLFAGLQTVDGDTAHVGPQVAERLGFNQATYVALVKGVKNNAITVRRLIEGGTQTLELPLPAMLSVTNTANTPRGPYLRGAMIAKRVNMKVYSLDDTGVDAGEVGLNGSPTVVSKVKNVTSTRTLTKFDGKAADQISGFVKASQEMTAAEAAGEET